MCVIIHNILNMVTLLLVSKILVRSATLIKIELTVYKIYFNIFTSIFILHLEFRKSSWPEWIAGRTASYCFIWWSRSTLQRHGILCCLANIIYKYFPKLEKFPCCGISIHLQKNRQALAHNSDQDHIKQIKMQTVK